MGTSKKYQSLLFKGVILAAMVALLAGAVSSVYAAGGNCAAPVVTATPVAPATGGSSTNCAAPNTGASSAPAQTSGSFLFRQWNNYAFSLLLRSQAAIANGQARGYNTAAMEKALPELQALMNKPVDSNKWVGDVQGAYWNLKRAYNQFRSDHPDLFTNTGTTGVANTGGAANNSCAAPATGGSASSSSSSSSSSVSATPAASATMAASATPSATAVVTATATQPVATATKPVATATAAAPATGGSSSSSATNCAAPATVATSTPMATATKAATAAVPATGGSANNCAAPVVTATPVAPATGGSASNNCAAPNTGATTPVTGSFLFRQWNNYAFSLLIRSQAAIASGKARGYDTAAMEKALPDLQALMNRPVDSNRWVNDVQGSYWNLKRAYNQFRAAHADLFVNQGTTGVANTGGNASSNSSANNNCSCAPAATPAP